MVVGGKSVSMLRVGSKEDIFPIRFSENGIKEAFQKEYAKLQNVTDSDPRTAPSLGVALLKHTQWFASEDGSKKHLKFSAPH